MAGFGTFDAGNALTQGFQIGAAISKNRQANALAQAQMYGGLPLEEQVRYKQQRQMIEDSRSDTEWQQGQEDRLYGISQRPAAEERASAETEQLRASARAQAAQAAATASDQELAEASRMGQQMYGAITQTIAQMDAGDPAAWDRFEALFGEQMQGAGFDPTAVGPEHAQVIRRVFEGMMEGFDQEYTDRSIAASQQGMIAPRGKEDFRRATPEEAVKYGAQAGQFGPDNRFYPNNPPDGRVIESTPDGGFRIIEGPGAGAPGQSVGDVYNPAEVESTLNLITDLLDDEALPRVTGALEGGGGNDVGEIGPLGRSYYGDKGLATIQKINQLQSRAWLAARQMLKGGGAITDYESRKAEAAVARLERAQGDDEFRQALIDLQDAIISGREKILAQNGGQQPNSAPVSPSGQTQGASASNNPFATMSSAERAQVDVSTLSMEELDQYLEAVSP